MFQVVLLRLERAVDGKNDPAIRCKRKRRDVLIDRANRFFEVLRASEPRHERRKKARRTHHQCDPDPPAPSFPLSERNASHRHGLGCAASYAWQHGVCLGVNSITSTRVPSGSYASMLFFPSRPTSGPSNFFQPRFFNSAATTFASFTPSEK